MEQNTPETINLKVKTLGHVRGDTRAQLLKEAANDIHQYFKQLGFLSVSRQHFKPFFEGLAERTERNTVVEVLSYLEAMGKIEENQYIKLTWVYESKTLTSIDYGSYALLKTKKACISNGNKSLVKRAIPYKCTNYLIH